MLGAGDSEQPGDGPAPDTTAIAVPRPDLATTPDLAQAHRWAQAVLGGQATEWRLLAPDRQPLAVYGTLQDVESVLLARNGEGYQVYAVVNLVPEYRLAQLRSRGGHVSKLDVSEVRAVWVDLDAAADAADRVVRSPLAPSVVVRSSQHSKLHAYWLVRNLPPDEFASYQRALIAHFGSDTAVVDLPRVMRVPGFIHRKDGRQPVRSELLLNDDSLVYTSEQLRAAFGVAPEPVDTGRSTQLNIVPDLQAGAVELVVAALKQPDLSRLENRHACLKAALNLGARAGRLDDMLRYLQDDDIRTSWVKDGDVRSHSQWLSEIDRWASAEITGNTYGLPTLTQNGFDVPDLPKREQPAPAARTRLLHLADLLTQPNPRWLVREILMEDTVAMVYGPPGAGKSFLVMDLALHLATGRAHWAGRRIQPGGVVYLVGEGQQSMGKRSRAWFKYHARGTDEAAARGLVVALNAGPLSTAKPDAALVTIAEAVTMLHQDGYQPRLVIVDTVSRHMEGDENAAMDAKRFIAAADMVRREHGVVVLLVHHTGKNVERGARGSSVFKGDVDPMLQVDGDTSTVALDPDKQKDAAAMGAGLMFHREVVDLGADEDGEPVTSLALEYDAAASGTVVSRLDPKQLDVLRLLGMLNRDLSSSQRGVDRDELWEVVKAQGTYENKNSFRTCMYRLSDGYGDRQGLRVVKEIDGRYEIVDWSVVPPPSPADDDPEDEEDEDEAPEDMLQPEPGHGEAARWERRVKVRRLVARD